MAKVWEFCIYVQMTAATKAALARREFDTPTVTLRRFNGDMLAEGRTKFTSENPLAALEAAFAVAEKHGLLIEAYVQDGVNKAGEAKELAPTALHYGRGAGEKKVYSPKVLASLDKRLQVNKFMRFSFLNPKEGGKAKTPINPDFII